MPMDASFRPAPWQRGPVGRDLSWGSLLVAAVLVYFAIRTGAIR